MFIFVYIEPYLDRSSDTFVRVCVSHLLDEFNWIVNMFYVFFSLVNLIGLMCVYVPPSL